MKKILFILIIGLVLGCATQTTPAPEIDIDATVEARLAQKLLEEKKLEPTTTPLFQETIFVAPLFQGTIFVAPETLTESDPTSFESISSKEDDNREMFDRRVDGWINIKPYLFEANFSDNLKIEVQVNPEFGTKEKAKQIALEYLPSIGRIPSYLRKDVETIWLHDGNETYGGGNKNLLIYHGSTKKYVKKGILEETFMHEAVHASLDEYHVFSKEWIDAQSKDNGFISNYALKFPQREDLAETFPICFGLKYKPSAFNEIVREMIFEIIPNRLEYCDKYFFDGLGY